MEEAQLYFNTREGVNGIELMVHDPEEGRVAFIRHQQGGRAADAAGTWRQLNGTILNALEVERAPMFLILSLIILVAALNIV